MNARREILHAPRNIASCRLLRVAVRDVRHFFDKRSEDRKVEGSDELQNLSRKDRAYDRIKYEQELQSMNWLEKFIFRAYVAAFRACSGSMRVYLARRLGVRIGKNCQLYYCNLSTEPYLISIGDNCKITYGVTFMTHDGAKWVLEQNHDFDGTKFGPITIRDNSFVGVNSIIMPDVEIGPNSIVGAGSVVTRDVPPSTVYAGNPARFICTYDEYLEKCRRKNTGNIPRENLKEVLTMMFKRELDQKK